MLSILIQCYPRVLANVIYDYVLKCYVCKSVHNVECRYTTNGMKEELKDLCKYHYIEDRYFVPECEQCFGRATHITIDYSTLLCGGHSSNQVTIRFLSECSELNCVNRANYTRYTGMSYCSNHMIPTDFLNIRDTRREVKSNITCYDCKKAIEYFVTCSCKIIYCLLCACRSCQVNNKNITSCSYCYHRHNNKDDIYYRYRDVYKKLLQCAINNCSFYVTNLTNNNMYCNHHSYVNMTDDVCKDISNYYNKKSNMMSSNKFLIISFVWILYSLYHSCNS